MISIIDVGHKYELLTLDGKLKQTLTFVKRFDPKNKSRFPGNKDAYSGTTLQSVLQCLCNRIRFLQNQIPCLENQMILQHLQSSIALLEQRAAKRHKLELETNNIEWFEFAKLCPTCGHTTCNHK